MDINNIFLEGNLVKEPKLITTQAGKEILKLRLASHRQYKDKEESLFVNITAFGTLAVTCSNYLQKGSKVIVEGELRSDTYTNSEGETTTEIYIVAKDIHFVGAIKKMEKAEDVTYVGTTSPGKFDVEVTATGSNPDANKAISTSESDAANSLFE